MKYKWFYLWILLCTASIVHADIDAQIDVIKNASIEERFKLMNAFKQEIIQMKEEERIHAITQLKGITKSKHGDRALKEIRKHIHAEHNKKNRSNIDNEANTEVENETENQISTEIENNIGGEIENDGDNDD